MENASSSSALHLDSHLSIHGRKRLLKVFSFCLSWRVGAWRGRSPLEIAARLHVWNFSTLQLYKERFKKTPVMTSNLSFANQHAFMIINVINDTMNFFGTFALLLCHFEKHAVNPMPCFEVYSKAVSWQFLGTKRGVALKSCNFTSVIWRDGRNFETHSVL